MTDEGKNPLRYEIWMDESNRYWLVSNYSIRYEAIKKDKILINKYNTLFGENGAKT